MRLFVIDHSGGIIGEEYNLVLNDVITRIEGIERCADAIEEPKGLGTFVAVNHPAAVGIRALVRYRAERRRRVQWFRDLLDSARLAADRLPHE